MIVNPDRRRRMIKIAIVVASDMAIKIIFSKGDIVDLTVLKKSLLTDRYETMIIVKSNSKRLKRVTDVSKYSFSQGPYLEREERITDQSSCKTNVPGEMGCSTDPKIVDPFTRFADNT